MDAQPLGATEHLPMEEHALKANLPEGVGLEGAGLINASNLVPSSLASLQSGGAGELALRNYADPQMYELGVAVADQFVSMHRQLVDQRIAEHLGAGSLLEADLRSSDPRYLQANSSAIGQVPSQLQDEIKRLKEELENKKAVGTELQKLVGQCADVIPEPLKHKMQAELGRLGQG